MPEFVPCNKRGGFFLKGLQQFDTPCIFDDEYVEESWLHNSRFYYGVIIGGQIGSPTYVGKESLLRPYVVVENGVYIGKRVQIESGVLIRHHVRIADDVHIYANAVVSAYCQVGYNVFIGPGAVLLNTRHPSVKLRNREACLLCREDAGVCVEHDVVIGAGAIIMPGVRIGAGAVIAAGSLVVRDVSPGHCMMGVPARSPKDASAINCKWNSNFYPYGSPPCL
jgi:acetyltransferase-like isoleucine patch superfamily enzyme